MKLAILALFAVLVTASAQTVSQWEEMAVRKYPELGVAGSPFNNAFLLAVTEKNSVPHFFDSHDWPMRLADEIAPRFYPASPPPKTGSKDPGIVPVPSGKIGLEDLGAIPAPPQKKGSEDLGGVRETPRPSASEFLDAPAKNPFDKFDADKYLRDRQEARIQKAEQWKRGGRRFILFPFVLLAACSVSWFVGELISIPFLVLRIWSANAGFRMLVGALFWIASLATLLLSLIGFFASWDELRIWALALTWLIAIFLAAGLSILTMNLRLYADAVFADTTNRGRTDYLRAVREHGGGKRPFFVERHFEKKAAYDDAIRERMRKINPNRSPQFSPDNP